MGEAVSEREEGGRMCKAEHGGRLAIGRLLQMLKVEGK